MLKITVLYGQPSDPAAFEEHYAKTHIPLAEKIPALKQFEVCRVVATPDGSPPPFYRIAELWFENEADMQTAMASEEGQATNADVANFATGGATVLISEVG